jgi:hypothetical protein
MLRPVPKRINVKLRPKELELAILEAKPEIVDATKVHSIDLASKEEESTGVLETV